MASPDAGSESALRRGLPRVPGGEPWPPAGVLSAQAAGAPALESVAETAAADTGVAGAQRRESAGAVAPDAQIGASESDAGVSAPGVAVRRGLPRVAGGEPWPPAETTAITGAAAPETVATEVQRRESAGVVAPDAQIGASEPDTGAPASGVAVRRGLPRAAGGDSWPPAETAAMTGAAAVVSATEVQERQSAGAVAPDAQIGASEGDAGAPASRIVAPPAGPRAPLTVPRSVWPGRAAYHRPAPKPAPTRLGPFTRAQWAGAVVVGGGGLLFAAAMAVLLVRFVLSLDALRDFLAAYPGEYHLPEGAPVGIPAWLGWQHFFNVFLMVLIIRTGLTVRREKRPAVFWTPRRNKKGKTSLTIWFHQALDVLWIANGAVFVVLLFVTGQWMRIVPTSWEVFPNALSAALQYVSLDWPTENGWVNYNALQQLAYFSTVFVAAPLAIASGFRMSGLWPKKNARLNAAVPIDWARRVHFPTMLFFVAFIAIHVFLVLATGALRNLNHMYAAQGSTDPTAYADNWTGFWFFVLSLVVIAGAWVAARPMTIAPIARLFGTVSGR